MNTAGPRSPDRLIAGCRSWSAFYQQILQLSSGDDAKRRRQQGDAFERLTQLFLQTQPEYQSKLKSVWRWSEVPHEVRARLQLPATDEGIDLLAETRGGDLWAIQCKFHSDPDRAVTRQELGTFVALASVAGLSQRVVAHTSSQPIRKRSLLGDTVEIGLDRWLALDEPSWSLITAAVQGRPVRPEPTLSRPHQQEAITAARRHYLDQAASRGRLIMPCGTGKSLTAFWIAEALDARTILVAVPSLALIRQSLADWTREYLARGEVPEWLCVCSDDSVGTVESDSFVAEAYDLGIPVTTSHQEMAAFLSQPATGRRIIFTTYQSSGRLAEAAQEVEASFDLAVLDEAHRTVGAKSKTFAMLLQDDVVRIERRLFMTATERVLRETNDDVRSMDDEAVYGERFFQLTFKEAIAQGIISDYHILTISVSDEQVKKVIRENRLLDLGPDEEEAEAQAMAAGIALKRVFQEYGISHAISFHRSIRAADRFREQQDRLNALRVVGPETVNLHISSKKTAGQRAELLQSFVERDRALMTNARCLTEGVNVPAIDCVLFADPKQSVVDIVQAAGRALRRSPGKECGYILLPLIVPSGVDLDAFAETTAFRQVARTITALSTQDERIAEEFRAIEHRSQPSGRIVEVTGDVPVGLQLSLDQFASAIQAAVWQRAGRANWRPFEDARSFVRGLALESQEDWLVYCRSGARPPDIPAGPSTVYADQGWQNLGDWLGTGFVATYRRKYRPFEEARNFVRSLGLRNVQAWGDYRRSGARPADVPTNPNTVYADQGWQSWGDWLGTGRVATNAQEFRSFEDARSFVQSLGVKNSRAWKSYCKSGARPPDIPGKPDEVYADQGWRGWGDWFGTGTPSSRGRQWRSLEEARSFVRSLGLKSTDDWRNYCRSGDRPADIPTQPEAIYVEQGWQSWGDWLGTGTHSNRGRQWRSFEDARSFVRNLGLTSMDGWGDYCRSGALPADIPTNPNRVYASQGWQGLGDWLGTGRVANQRRKFRSFEEARGFVRSLGLESVGAWTDYLKTGALPADIPTNPNRVYANQGWQGLGDWLGTGRVANHRRKFRPFEDARSFVRSLGLKSGADWRDYSKSADRPADIPTAPWAVYADQGWQSWGDWLGTGALSNRGRQWRSFEDAQSFVWSLVLKNQQGWRDYCKSGDRPPDIPTNPNRAYADQGWQSWGDWLGTEPK